MKSEKNEILKIDLKKIVIGNFNKFKKRYKELYHVLILYSYYINTHL